MRTKWLHWNQSTVRTMRLVLRFQWGSQEKEKLASSHFEHALGITVSMIVSLHTPPFATTELHYNSLGSYCFSSEDGAFDRDQFLCVCFNASLANKRRFADRVLFDVAAIMWYGFVPSHSTIYKKHLSTFQIVQREWCKHPSPPRWTGRKWEGFRFQLIIECLSGIQLFKMIKLSLSLHLFSF